MRRTFKIPLSLAAVGLLACKGPSTDTGDTDTPVGTPPATPPPTEVLRAFEGSWNLDRAESNYAGGYTLDFPYTSYGQTQSASIDITASAFSLNVLSTYDDGNPDYTYTQGPFTWTTNSLGRLEVQGFVGIDVFVFVCDHEPPEDLDSLRCRLAFGGNESADWFSTRIQ